MEEDTQHKLPPILANQGSNQFFNYRPKAPKQTIRKRILSSHLALHSAQLGGETECLFFSKEAITQKNASRTSKEVITVENKAVLTEGSSNYCPQVSRPSSAKRNSYNRKFGLVSHVLLNKDELNSKLEQLSKDQDSEAIIPKEIPTLKKSWL